MTLMWEFPDAKQIKRKWQTLKLITRCGRKQKESQTSVSSSAKVRPNLAA